MTIDVVIDNRIQVFIQRFQTQVYKEIHNKAVYKHFFLEIKIRKLN